MSTPAKDASLVLRKSLTSLKNDATGGPVSSVSFDVVEDLLTARGLGGRPCHRMAARCRPELHRHQKPTNKSSRVGQTLDRVRQFLELLEQFPRVVETLGLLSLAGATHTS